MPVAYSRFKGYLETQTCKSKKIILNPADPSVSRKLRPQIFFNQKTQSRKLFRDFCLHARLAQKARGRAGSEKMCADETTPATAKDFEKVHGLSSSQFYKSINKKNFTACTYIVYLFSLYLNRPKVRKIYIIRGPMFSSLYFGEACRLNILSCL